VLNIKSLPTGKALSNLDDLTDLLLFPQLPKHKDPTSNFLSKDIRRSNIGTATTANTKDLQGDDQESFRQTPPRSNKTILARLQSQVAA